MSVRKVNILSVELGESLDVAGFRHRGASIRDELGSRAIGAGVYEAYAGQPIWPYHYHHGVEEWLHVLSGAPVLRDTAGHRTLEPGDIVAFPSGYVGAHTVAGPGRFMIVSTGDHVEPWISVYPDSDKVGGPGGMLLRSSAVSYWHGEGTDPPVEQVSAKREPPTNARQPVVNVHSFPVAGPRPDAPRVRARGARIAPALQATRLGAQVIGLDPGEGSAPYHYEYGREGWVLVLTGTPTLRHPDGLDRLEPGDVVCFPAGPRGAHRLTNDADNIARVVFLSTMERPSNVHYPDDGKWLLRNAEDDLIMLRDGPPVSYWE